MEEYTLKMLSPRFFSSFLMYINVSYNTQGIIYNYNKFAKIWSTCMIRDISADSDCKFKFKSCFAFSAKLFRVIFHMYKHQKLL